MFKKINAFLAGLPMTIVAGVFLLLDFVPHLICIAMFAAIAIGDLFAAGS